ncbi:hypothetical protein [Streptomyces antimycoticus]|uniref:hypothetical protein n=1 Tax=Streptomyces TaxID=1883 RepID=UPI0033C51C20
MNPTLQTALAGFGAFSALSYGALAVWICAVTATKRRGHRTPITEAEIRAVDFDAELAKLTKETGR